MSDIFNVSWVGTGQIPVPGTISVFPNPTTGIITITASPRDMQDVVLTVYNAQGNLMLRKRDFQIIDLSPFENGIYYLTISTKDGNMIVRKIVLIK